MVLGVICVVRETLPLLLPSLQNTACDAEDTKDSISATSGINIFFITFTKTEHGIHTSRHWPATTACIRLPLQQYDQLQVTSASAKPPDLRRSSLGKA